MLQAAINLEESEASERVRASSRDGLILLLAPIFLNENAVAPAKSAEIRALGTRPIWRWRNKCAESGAFYYSRGTLRAGKAPSAGWSTQICLCCDRSQTHELVCHLAARHDRPKAADPFIVAHLSIYLGARDQLTAGPPHLGWRGRAGASWGWTRCCGRAGRGIRKSGRRSKPIN